MDDSLPARVDRSEIGAKGGKARADSLSPTRRREIARAAAAKRWSTDIPKAEADGVVTIAGRRIACAVLNSKVRVLTQETFLTAVGRAGKAKGGKGSERMALVDGLPPFLAARNLERFVSEELRRAATPVVYRTRSGGVAYGYDAQLLPLVCDVYRKARDAHMGALKAYQQGMAAGQPVEFKGVLLPNQEHIVRQCDALIFGLGTDGINALIDRATGYVDPEMLDENLRLVKAYVPGWLFPWVERFPEEFFQQIYRLYGWEYKPGCAKRPQYIGHFINKYVYDQLPPGTRERLQAETPRTPGGHRLTQFHRRLSPDTGIPHLSQQVTGTTTVLRLADAGSGTKGFEELFYRAFPRPEAPALPPKKPKQLPPADGAADGQSTLFPPSLFPELNGGGKK